MPTNETRQSTGNWLSRHSKKVGVGVAGAALALAGCASPTVEGKPATPPATATAEPSPSATETTPAVETIDTMSLPGYTDEQLDTYRAMMDLPYDDFIALPVESRTAALYALMLHGIENRSGYDGDFNMLDYGETAYSYVSPSINGVEAKKYLPNNMPLRGDASPLEVAQQNGALVFLIQASAETVVAAQVDDTYGVVPGDLVKKVASLTHYVGPDGLPMPDNNLYKNTLADAEEPAGLSPNTDANLSIAAGATKTTIVDESGEERSLWEITEVYEGYTYKKSYIGIPFEGPDGKTQYIWQLYSFQGQTDLEQAGLNTTSG